MSKSTVPLVVIFGSMLLVGYGVYQAPERLIRPTVARGSEPSEQQVSARNLVKRIGYVKAPLVKEASALCKSRKHAGVYWTLCDSGNPPFLFAIETSGKLRATIRLQGATNVDWEALAMDEQGRLYVGDIGNNYHNLKQRTIYRIDEPDRFDAKEAAEPVTVPVTGMWHYQFPDKPFDAESLMIQDGVFWIINKAKNPGETRLYKLPMVLEGTTQMIEEVGTLPKELAMVADASQSLDGKRVALVNKFYSAVFPLPSGKITDLCKAQPTYYEYELHKVEGCAWEGNDLILIAEDRKIYRLPLPHEVR